MQTNDANLDLEEDIEYLKQLQEWAAGSNEHQGKFFRKELPAEIAKLRVEG